jgi:putative drug exporter of the RND superfamily
MIYRLVQFLVRYRVVVIVAAAIALAAGGIFSGGVAGKLTSAGFEDPNSESRTAAEVLAHDFGRGDSNVLLLVTVRAGVDVDDPAVAAEGLALTREFAGEPGVVDVASYWSQRAAPLASVDRTQALVLGRIVGEPDDVATRIEQLTASYTRSDARFDIAVGGAAAIAAQLRDTTEADHIRAEAIAFPILLLLLLLVFRSVVAALLPLMVGAIAVVGALVILKLLTGVTDVAVYALNLTAGLGLGLAIDYSLFIVSRFREELAAGRAVNEAVVRTVRTAGRTVAFSGVTVAISLSALLIFPQVFLRSFAYSGIAVTAVAMVGAVVVLPALLAIFGHRVDALGIPGTRRRRPASAAGGGGWHRFAMAVMRRPIPIATGVTAVLLLLGAPFLNVEFGGIDSRVLPAGNQARVVSDEIRKNFAAREHAATTVVVPDIGDPVAGTTRIDAYAGELSAVPGVARVDAVTGSYIGGSRVAANPAAANHIDVEGTWLAVIPAVEPTSPQARSMVSDLRAVRAPFHGVLIGGPSAEFADSQQTLLQRLPVAIGIIAVVTFVLLFLMFGSLFVPTKAILLNLLSLTAMFGAMVWVFQDGHLSGLLDFTATGALDTTIPILMFCLAFGVSMDYEVFLLSRIKEEYDRTGDNAAAVASGLARTGGIVTAAAALLATVLFIVATSGITLIKLFGIGLMLAVIMDATLIRSCLVPAIMKLAGRVNWWLPRPLRRLHRRIEFSEAPDEDKSGKDNRRKGSYVEA